MVSHFYMKHCEQLRNADSGRKILPKGESPVGYPIQIGQPLNQIHAGNTKCTKQVIFIHLHMSNSS